MECVRLQRSAWAGLALDASDHRHLTDCAHCRAEVLRASQIHSSLVELRDVTFAVPDGLQDAILASVNRSPMIMARRIASDPRVRRIGVGVGVGAAAAAAVAGIVVARRRTRPSVAA